MVISNNRIKYCLMTDLNVLAPTVQRQQRTIKLPTFYHPLPVTYKYKHSNHTAQDLLILSVVENPHLKEQSLPVKSVTEMPMLVQLAERQLDIFKLRKDRDQAS